LGSPHTLPTGNNEPRDKKKTREKLKYHGNAMRELKKRMDILGQINQKSGAGFTMVEMVIYIGALALLVGTVTALLVWLVRASSEVHVRNELATGVEHAFALMVNEIKEAKSVYTPTTTSSQLSLATSNNVPDKETSTYIDFFLCGTRLCMKREFQTPQALTSEKIIIQNLEFIPVQTGSAASAHIIIEASYLDASQTLQTTASLRSYE
jgi:type II secretory pathway pseudopilin PulG